MWHLCWPDAQPPACLHKLTCKVGTAVISGGQVQRRGGGKPPKGESGGDPGRASNMCPVLTRKPREKGDWMRQRRTGQQRELRAHSQRELAATRARAWFRKP